MNFPSPTKKPTRIYRGKIAVVVAVAVLVALAVVEIVVVAVIPIYPTTSAPTSPEKLSSLPKILVWVSFN